MRIKYQQFVSSNFDTDFAGYMVHPYTLPMLLEDSGCPLTPQLDSEASSVSSEKDSDASPLDSEGSPAYFSVRNLARPDVYSEAEYSVAPLVLDSEADSGTGSVCEEEADEAQDQVSRVKIDFCRSFGFERRMALTLLTI